MASTGMDSVVLNWDPQQVLRATKIPEEEWEKHRMWICDLHESGSTLEDIIAVMRYHSLQEETYFQPTRKQFVSRLKKWDLRRYGLNQSTKLASSDLATEARLYSGSSGKTNSLLKSLQRHQSKCPWCEYASDIYPAIQRNIRLAAKHGPLSKEEVGQKLDLAEFHLAAKDSDGAWTLYAEILYRSQTCSDLDRLLITIKILYSSIRSNEQKRAKTHFAYLLLLNEYNPEVSAEPLWMMDMLRGIVCQACGLLDLATQHVVRAFDYPAMNNIPRPRRILQAQKELIAEISGQVGARLSYQWSIRQSFANPRDLTPTRCMELFLQWCLEQVEGDGYRVMLNYAREQPWTRAPSLQSFKDFECVALFCYLWQKYRDAQKSHWQVGSSAGETIFLIVEHLKQRLHIPAQLIFSTVSSMTADFETPSLATEHADFGVEQIARQSFISMKHYTVLDWHNLYEGHYWNGSMVFNEAYASLGSDIDATDEQSQFRESFQSFVRQFAQAHFPERTVIQSLEEPETYIWRATSTTDIAHSANGEKDETNVTGSGQSNPVISTIRSVALPLQSSISTSPPPTPSVRPMSSTLPTIQEANERPVSSTSVDVLATPRSSLSSSKASLRSFQRLGRIADLLLKRGGSGANQLPSEVMDRDSHSSWSLRRLTGVSYLSVATTADGEAEEDTIMEEAPFQN